MENSSKSWNEVLARIFSILNSNTLLSFKPTAFDLEVASVKSIFTHRKSFAFIVLNGPAGAGKSTVGKILEQIGYQRIPRITNRPMRTGEVNGKDYYFVDQSTFKELADTGSIVAQKTTYEFHRGFLRKSFHELKDSKGRGYSEGDSSLAAIKEVQKEINLSPENVLHIFLLPPSYKEWQRRLKKQHKEGHFNEQELHLRIQEGIHYLEKSILHRQDFPRMLYLVNDEEDRLRSVLNETLNDENSHLLIFSCDQKGKPQCLSTKSYSHLTGQYHWIVVAYLFNKNGELLLQKRKDSGVWDHSAAGHVDAGEKGEEAIYREIKEELGVKTKLTFLSKGFIKHPLTPTTRRHFFELYTGQVMEPFSIDPKEVEEVRFFTFKELEKLLEENPQSFSGGLHATLSLAKKALAGSRATSRRR